MGARKLPGMPNVASGEREGEGEGGGGTLPVGIPSRGKKQYPESFYNMETDVNSYSVG